ncbi:4389_t:CDS:10 [Acaulospora morrowiae]|uniref:Presenilin n=1 Tax=Acaulospora morrowiae TaxID=94023 RepID=A0A9N9AGM2_9GLOM|nr:4389_t:CDS:10 [Acaulospora morrowiae]
MSNLFSTSSATDQNNLLDEVDLASRNDSTRRGSEAQVSTDDEQTTTSPAIVSTSPEVTSYSCANCGNPASFLCKACEQAGPRYCSPKCQNEDWTKGHSSVCVGTHVRTFQEGSDAEGSSSAVRRANNKIYGRGNIAQIINNKTKRMSRDGPGSQGTQQSTDQQPPTFDADQANEFRFYMQQVYRIIKPVVFCIVLSILWVKVSLRAPEFSPRSGDSLINSSNNSNSSAQFFNSFVTAGILILQIIVVTIIIVCLFKHGCIKKCIDPHRILHVCGALASRVYGIPSHFVRCASRLLSITTVLSIPLDYITLTFSLWNFATVGLISVFWKGPLLLQQIYLTVMSSLMAFSLTGLSPWTTWILLGLLAVWDLIAVLCPFGPLRILVESSREDQREIPALLYSVNAVWLMASPSISSQISNGEPTASLLNTRANTRSSFASLRQSLAFKTRETSSGYVGEEIPLSENVRHTHFNPTSNLEAEDEGGTGNSSHDADTSVIPPKRNQSSGYQRQIDDDHPQDDGGSVDEEEEERNGLKLGLGDFVFYSVLVARAAMFDWITTVACVVAVLTGLNTTIFLLVIYKKALPALPISIAFGMLFYFLSRWMLAPYMQFLGLSLVSV